MSSSYNCENTSPNFADPDFVQTHGVVDDLYPKAYFEVSAKTGFDDMATTRTAYPLVMSSTAQPKANTWVLVEVDISGCFTDDQSAEFAFTFFEMPGTLSIYIDYANLISTPSTDQQGAKETGQIAIGTSRTDEVLRQPRVETDVQPAEPSLATVGVNDALHFARPLVRHTITGAGLGEL
eukprot:m51a1_g8631 hypothetical protein (180) ;mRNA; r:112602-115376